MKLKLFLTSLIFFLASNQSYTKDFYHPEDETLVASTHKNVITLCRKLFNEKDQILRFEEHTDEVLNVKWLPKKLCSSNLPEIMSSSRKELIRWCYNIDKKDKSFEVLRRIDLDY